MVIDFSIYIFHKYFFFQLDCNRKADQTCRFQFHFFNLKLRLWKFEYYNGRNEDLLN